MFKNRNWYLRSIVAAVVLVLSLSIPTIRAGSAHDKGSIPAAPAERQSIANESSADSFDICLQSDTTGNILKIDSRTGCYQFIECRRVPTLDGRSPISFTGCGTISREGPCWFREKITLQDGSRVIATVFRHCGAITTGWGTATVKASRIGGSFKISDASIANNTCACEAPSL